MKSAIIFAVSDAVSSRMRIGGRTRLSSVLKIIVYGPFCQEIFMFSTSSYRDIQWECIFSYGLLAVLTIFFAVFFGPTSSVLPYVMALALILIILIASRLIGIEEAAGAEVK